ncbi:MAG: alpha/beta fold hydrolase [Desulfobacterales bacterium]|nr:alpha/beta fold hydrolase [Desulfobacterales bacterium]
MPVENEISQQKIDILAQDGHRLKITVFDKRTGEDGSPVIICFPAMGVNADYYSGFARGLAGQDITVATADLRGIGTSSLRASKGTNFGYFEMVHYDWPAVVGQVEEMFPQQKIFLLDHSMGGQLTSLYLSLQKKGRIAGLILITTNSVYYRGYGFPDCVKVLAGINLAFLISRVMGYLPGHRFGFGGLEAKNVIRDWARQGRTGKYEILGSKLDYDALLGAIELPVISISIEGDFFAPASAVRHLAGKMKNAEVTLVHLKPEALNLKRKYHFSWAKRPENLISLILDWMISVAPDTVTGERS